jgi:hypothetical protein
LKDYSGPFDPEFELAKLSRVALARLGREYMLYGHIRDRGLMPIVGVRFGAHAVDEIAIDEWMGASPLYTRRMRRALAIDGDGIPALMKSLQLDVGLPHRYMDVRFEIESETVGFFQLNCCRALLDVEPFGDKAVVSMCHTMEDPTFDATAYAVNPQARMRPVHRPPRTPADRLPHCRWQVRIDSSEPAAPEPEITRRNRDCELVSFELDPPDTAAGEAGEGAAGKGRTTYHGEFDPDFQLDALSQATLVRVCKEFLLQHQLLTRASAIALVARFGEQAMREVLTSQWRAVAPLTSRRVCRAMAIEGDDAEAMLKMLQLTPLFPHDYLRLRSELLGPDRAHLWVEDCAALRDSEPRGLLSLLDDPECPGLNTMVQALNPKARCRPIANSGHRGSGPAWEICIEDGAEPAPEPDEAAFIARSTVSNIDLERS